MRENFEQGDEVFFEDSLTPKLENFNNFLISKESLDFIFNPYHFSGHEFLMDLLVDGYGRTSQEDAPRCLPIFIARRTEWSRGIHTAYMQALPKRIKDFDN